MRLRERFHKWFFYTSLLESIVLVSWALSSVQHKPIVDEAIVLYWCAIATMNLVYGLINYHTAMRTLKTVQRFDKSATEETVLGEYVRFSLRIAKVRLSVVPLMLAVGVMSIFAPSNTPNVSRPLLQVVFGFVFLVALLWNETAFAIINRGEYLRHRRSRGK